MTDSNLNKTLSRLSARAASSVVSRGRIASSALNAALLRRLSARPGEADSLLADPVFEVAHSWESANCDLDSLAGKLLHPDLVAALDQAKEERMPRDISPWSHQLAAWKAASEGLSCLVSSGTSSGKTECFMIPMLDDLLCDPADGLLTGVRAIIVYPLNALIESQRERLAAWSEPLRNRFRFALYNGLTPKGPRQQQPGLLSAAEIGNRRDIRETPPAILVTNITMLEYLLLRTQDRSILEKSQGLLRWIILDEAHGYIGAQAAEMALLLRRVRAAFGVKPNQVRLMATSATISEGSGTDAKLKRFTADLAGLGEDRVRVIHGRTTNPVLPRAEGDEPFDPALLRRESPAELWKRLAPHPRIQRLKRQMAEEGKTLSGAAKILFGPEDGSRRLDKTQAVLDAAARAKCPEKGTLLLPWRAHVFHRSQWGLWVCVDPSCNLRDPELAAEDSDWGFGAVWLKQRDRCDCGTLVFELFVCNECGTPHLVSGVKVGEMMRLLPVRPIETDDFSVDMEPASEADDQDEAGHDTVVLLPGRGSSEDRFLNLDDGKVFDNDPPADTRWIRIRLYKDYSDRACCPGASTAWLAPQHYGPAFFMGVALPASIESLARPSDESGRPMGGRRALTFSDSRQGTARLAAKLQQDAERNLTRAFLYHSVQQNRGPEEKEREMLEKRLKVFRKDPKTFADDILYAEMELAGGETPVTWKELVNSFAQHNELCEFAVDVWSERALGGSEMANEPMKLAEMFLYRELLRRPKVQNNAETMGLVRLSFPDLERKAKAQLPRILSEMGVDKEGWTGLILAAVDFVFRDRLAVRLPSDWMMRLVNPRWGMGSYSICSSDLPQSEHPTGSRPWPGSAPKTAKPSRLHRLVYTLIQGDYKSKIDQDRAGEVLSEIWSLIVSTAARDIGKGAYKLDFGKAAVVRLDSGWLCPVTRRVFGYSPAGRTPYDADQLLSSLKLPRIPKGNPGGLDAVARTETERWCQEDDRVAELRRVGLWTDLHDRAATYVPFLRAQEHSAQIERPVLAHYETQFKEGRINLLNCSTTMEMGVDIPDVQLVVNSNTPPSISNYRQRLGRAGRRGEPWAFGITFCRELPLDRMVFDDPKRFLATRLTAPAVRLDSSILVARHVHAALLGAFLRDRPSGLGLQVSAGAGSFFGATDSVDEPVQEENDADAFLDFLRGERSRTKHLASDLAHLTRGTAFEGIEASYLTAMTADAFENMLQFWRNEYSQLILRRDDATDPDVRRAFETRARRMKGEFLLAELARRVFTPSYGFPVDVVTFDHLSGHKRDGNFETIAFGERRGGASRTLDIAIREYAPGSEIVVDGLVHRSEGILPAWRAMADTSKLEDIQFFWECSNCRAFGLSRMYLDKCTECDTPEPSWNRSLRPAGFLGRRDPHTGYENLGYTPYEMPRLSASGGTWRVLPDPNGGRWRADSRGKVVTLSSGPHREGYAVCLDCGRAEAETGGKLLSERMQKHKPLASVRKAKLKAGYCPGGFTHPERVQRNVRLVHEALTDVFELQLPSGATRFQGLALAAGLREALAERLGTEAREIGISVDFSRGPAGEDRVSAFLHDRASGGAGLSSRLSETEWFDDCLKRACSRLSCQEDCTHGCSTCILRPDLNFGEERLDRKGGLKLAQELQNRLQLPEAMRIFGPETRNLNATVANWLSRQQNRTKGFVLVSLYLHGDPKEWELAAWRVDELFSHLKKAGVKIEIVLENQALAKGMTLAQKLDLYRLSYNSSLSLVAEAPVVQGAAVIAVIKRSRDQIVAIASTAADEAKPGPTWGLGEQSVLVCGPVPKLPKTSDFIREHLVTLSSGNAHIIRVGPRLDGRAVDFGSSFWKLLRDERPLIVNAIRTHKVREAVYTDRYLFTPIVLRLLFEVIRKTPGGRPGSLSISTSRITGAANRSWAIFHNFPDDNMRREVLENLFRGAKINVLSKDELQHERQLELRLVDGRTVNILLDHGFGAWRAQGAPKHNFSDEPAGQVRSLKSSDFRISVKPGHEVPVVLEDIKAAD